MVARGCAWLQGGVHGCQGACMVTRGVCVWLLGGMHGCQGACMVAGGGGHAWLLQGMHGCWGACVVAGGHAWLLGGAWLPGGGVRGIRRDTVNERVVRILLECILVSTACHQAIHIYGLLRVRLY